MIFLDTTTRSLEIDLAGAVSATQLPFITHYVDLNTSFAVTDIESNNGTSNDTTAVTLVAAPGASTFRQIKTISVYNADSANATVTVQYNDNSTLRTIVKVILEPNWTLQYEETSGWRVTDENGVLQTGATIVDISGTPANNQLAVWLTSSQLEGDSNLTWDGTDFAVNTNGFFVDGSASNIGVRTTNPTSVAGFSGALLELAGGQPGIVLDASGSTQEINIWTDSATLFIDSSGHATGASNTIVFRTEETNSQTSPTTRLTIGANGNILFGSSVVPPGTGTVGLIFEDGTALSTMGINTAGLYANDVAGTTEMFAIDEADNAAQLTPHNFSLFVPTISEPYPWDYYAKNPYLGMEINVDIAKLVRLVEQLTNEQIIYIHQLPINEHLVWMDVQRANMHRASKVYEEWEDRVEDANLRPPPIPTIKRPPDWLLSRLQAQGKWDEGIYSTEQSKLERWKTHNSRRK